MAPLPPDVPTESLSVNLAAPASAEAHRKQDLATPAGGVLLGTNAEGEARLCGGYLPCGACGPCGAAAHLSCLAPIRPGLDGVPGGVAGGVTLPGRFLAPLQPLEDVEALAGPLALIAAAGPTYQAAVLAGAIPGDTVLLFGAKDPDALPVRLLSTMGLRPTLVSNQETPEPASGRVHLMDLCPDEQTLAAWLPLTGHCLTCTLVGPTPGLPLTADLGHLLAGQTPARWVRDLHPHLTLELLALARRMDLEGAAQLCTPQELPAKIATMDPLSGQPWPVARNL